MLKPSNTYFQLRTIGLDEDTLEDRLQPVYEKYPALNINYCLYQGILDVRLSSYAVDYMWDQLKKIGSECRELLAEDCFCYGHHSLAQVIFEQLRALEKSLSVAESCTGGQVSNVFTDMPGVSKVFAGGVVYYTNDVKIDLWGVPESVIQQHGVVSDEVAVAMATTVTEKFSTSYGLSVTGFVGPDGGTSEKSVGTIYIGYHSPSGAWAQKIVYPGQREAVKVRVVLDWMRRKLNQYKVEDFMANIEME